MKGQHIVRAFMKANMIGPSDFFRSRLPEHVELRREAIELLRATGLSYADIGRAIHKDPKTVTYWLSAELRQRKSERDRRYHAKHKSGINPNFSSARVHAVPPLAGDLQ